MNDLGHKETDKLLEELERKINREYRQAVIETQQKLTEYFADFKRKDQIWQEWVKDGKKTEKEWKEWRTGQMMVGDRWKEMRDTLAEDYHNANQIARSMVNGYMPDVYALNHNYSTFLVEKGAKVDTSYTLYDRQTVERLIRDEPELLQPPGASMKKKLAFRKDLAWQKGQIQSVTLQSILQGESVGKMANRIAETMGEFNHAASIRYARTATTSAENAGRLDGYKRADNMGIKMKQTWIATLDGRTRHEHRQLDGQTVGIDEPFKVDGYEIRYPGDPQAEAFLIWNCRCTTIAQIDGFERNPEDMGLRYDEKLGTMSYEEWKGEHEKPAAPGFVFEPAVTIAEAEDYISRYVDKNTMFGLGVSYDGISVDVANEINKTFGQLYDTFDIPKFGGIKAPKGNSKEGKMIEHATAAYSPARKSFYLNRKSLKTLKVAEQNLAEERKSLTDILTHPEKYDLSRARASVRAMIENSRESGRATIPLTVPEVIYHEFGHSLEKMCHNHADWGTVLANMKKYNTKVSGYACQDASEYVAESFCSYMKGEKVIDPVLARVFDSFRR